MKNTPQFDALEKIGNEYQLALSTSQDTQKVAQEIGDRGLAVMEVVSIVHALRNNVGDPASQVERIVEILAKYLPEGWDAEGQDEEPEGGSYQGGRVLDMTGDVRIPIYSDEPSLYGPPPGTERVVVSLAATVEVEMELKLEEGESTRGDAKGKVELSQDERWKASVLANGAHAEWSATEAKVVPARRTTDVDASDARHEQI